MKIKSDESLAKKLSLRTTSRSKNESYSDILLDGNKIGKIMSKYKRLTTKCEVGIGLTETSGNIVNDYEKVVNRLVELEDKIESGRLVELPCNVGDTVYRVYGKCDGNSCPYSGNYGQWRCNYKGKERCKAFIDECNFSYTMLNEIGKNIFVTKEAAEAKLKELTEVK